MNLPGRYHHVSEENRTLTQVSLTLNSQAYSEILPTPSPEWQISTLLFKTETPCIISLNR